MGQPTPPRIPAGMRDILPEQMIKRQYVIDVITHVFEEFGFEPLQTSAIELSETLLGKYGEDAERLIYKAWYGNEPGGEFALRYDLSVPLARVAAQYNNNIVRPFKRYQIAPVWRADRPQKGRYREFFQCDADIVGSSSMMADAEVFALVYHVLHRLGFTAFTISINNRKVLGGIAQYAGVPDQIRPGLYRSIDKLDKIGLDGVRRELMMVGVAKDAQQPLQHALLVGIQGKVSVEDMQTHLIEQEGLSAELAAAVSDPLNALVRQSVDDNIPGGELQAYTFQMVGELAPQLRDFYGDEREMIPSDVVDRLLELLQVSGDPQSVIKDLLSYMGQIPVAVEGLNELRDLFTYLDAMGIPESAYDLNFAMVRGLAYYTGPIVEVTITEPKAMPSITGGGRYDGLIGLFADSSYPAVGISLGIERIIDAMDELDMFPESLRAATAEVLVTIFNEETVTVSLQAATLLRAAGLKTSLYFDYGERLGGQLGYASNKGIPYVVIVGPDELANNQATVRKLGKTRDDSEERTVALAGIAEAIKNW